MSKYLFYDQYKSLCLLKLWEFLDTLDIQTSIILHFYLSKSNRWVLLWGKGISELNKAELRGTAVCIISWKWKFPFFTWFGGGSVSQWLSPIILNLTFPQLCFPTLLQLQQCWYSSLLQLDSLKAARTSSKKCALHLDEVHNLGTYDMTDIE